MKPTQEQLDRYKQDLANHKKFVHDYRFFLSRICEHLDFVDSSKAWTTEEIKKRITGEIDMYSSLEAPNKPGYDFANNH